MKMYYFERVLLYAIVTSVILASFTIAAEPDAILTPSEGKTLIRFITDGSTIAQEIVWPTERRTQALNYKLDAAHFYRLHTKFSYVLWPSELWLKGCQVKEDTNVEKAKRHCMTWLGKIAVASLIPPDIHNRLIALKDVPVSGRVWGQQVSADLVISQCVDQNPRWEMQEDGTYISLLIVPESGVEKGQTLVNFATKIAKTYLNLRDDEKEKLKVAGEVQDGLVFGTMVVGPQIPEGLDAQGEGKWRRTHLRHWWEPVSFCSNGRFVFFMILEFDDPWQMLSGSRHPDRF